jgi:predicted transport protein
LLGDGLFAFSPSITNLATMSLFKIQTEKLKKIEATEHLEKKVQTLVENNLLDVLDIHFLYTEFPTTWGGRVDTLGIDKMGSPVIIEYKRGSDESVINQALSYLKWLLDHKAEFEKLVQQNEVVSKIEVDWDSPRVICIAESYNKFDLDTVDLLPINIELLKYRFYSDDLFYIEPENYQKVRTAMSGIVKKANNQKEKGEVLQKNYTLEDHISKAGDKTKSLFLQLRERILALDKNIIEETKAKYVAYKTATNFVDVVILGDSLKIFLNIKSGSLKDPDNLARDMEKPRHIGHWGNGDYEIKFDHEVNLEKVFNLIEQSYHYNL